MKYTITTENSDKEKESLEQIKKNIESFNSFYFEAGAGSGKTYSLVKAISFSLNQYQLLLKSNRQKIRCITYTNVAADEIKGRIGNSAFVEVSTIHEFLSDMCMNFQEDLKDIHIKKLKYECHKLTVQTELPVNVIDQMGIERCIDINELEKIKKIKWAKKKSKKLDFIDEMVRLKDKIFSEENVDKYLKKDFGKLKEEFINISSSKSNFESYLKKLIKIKKYKKVILDGIHKKIEYTPDFNIDVLENMCISHDTLLEYCHELFKRNVIVKQVLSDSYPIIFVDEYQDTNIHVIKLLQLVEEYCYSKNKKFLVGYFGDTKQSIYEDGVGKEFQKIYNDRIVDEIARGKITRVKKEFNRRSSNKIISLANRIRKDDMEQKSIYSDFVGNEIIYSQELFEDVIKFLKESWKIEDKNPLNCLVLNRKTIAKNAGFEKVFNIYNKTNYFYNDKDILFNKEKFSLVSKALYKIAFILRKLKSGEEFFIANLFELSEFNKKYEFNLKALRKVLQVLMVKHDGLENITLENYLKLLFNLSDVGFSDNEIQIYHSLFKFRKNIVLTDYDSFLEFILKYFNLKDENNINELFNIDMQEFINWINFVDGNNGEIIFHTYHGTKGEEYENVLIILEETFGPNNNKKYFKKLFKFLNDESEDKFNEDIQKKYDEEIITNLQNLLYVAVTRAKNNLCILYQGHDNELKMEIGRFLENI
ncbi:UvrD-helicase domain-containing protein [Streptococcus rifensis]